MKRYRKKKEQELLEGKRAELEKELSKLKAYLKGCHKSETDDVMIIMIKKPLFISTMRKKEDNYAGFGD